MAMIRPAAVLFLVLTLLTGVGYPLLVTGLAQLTLPFPANGSLVGQDGRPAPDPGQAACSRLIGQQFSAPGYFWGRLSATVPPYNAAASSGSNLGPLNPALTAHAKERARSLTAFGGSAQGIPVDLLTASGSGLDPHISLAAALYQIPRVASARGLATGQVEELVRRNAAGRTWGLLGEPRVNVLLLNLALDKLAAR
jgi:K+-transporting ATPase ATPase C chain